MSTSSATSFSRCGLRNDQNSCTRTVDLHSRNPLAHTTKAKFPRSQIGKNGKDAGDFAARQPPVAQLPCHPPVHDLHSIEE
jgi:hypothetical protein